MTMPRQPGSPLPFQEFDWQPGETGPMVFDWVRLEPNGRTTTCIQIQVRTDLGGATPAWRNTWRFYDGAGRVVQEYADHPSGVSVVNTSFEGRGLKRRETAPHPATGSGAFLESDWLDNTLAATTQTYDELRRPLVTTLPDG